MKWLVVLSLVAGLAHAQTWREAPEVAAVFERAGVAGAFVMYDVEGGRMVGCHRERAERRYLPASTFKVLNSLIGLSVGAVEGVEERLPYGGAPQPYPAWERDMGLREAIKLSNVPIYQALARRIGLERMARGVAAVGYGNGTIGSVVDRFWLDGPLTISAVEQTRFLERLARGRLPFSARTQRQVREILLLERGDGWALHGKTGWAVNEAPKVGWWVGWVEREGAVYPFALNIDAPDAADLPRRAELGKASLRALGVLP